ncbi:hypothetical protein E2C01_091669 [Portunus trituberculatus]|uniref:Uncharacterized protein n=1 Tax=Portunus trituberculatus TaxID=210409 RepID=A0A5B7JEJ7_PORTR|nr:hypothetical protein [Portunus trituberculatus]
MRRHSSESDRRRHGSGSLQAPYMRGEMDPTQAAMLFRDSRGVSTRAVGKRRKLD